MGYVPVLFFIKSFHKQKLIADISDGNQGQLIATNDSLPISRISMKKNPMMLPTSVLSRKPGRWQMQCENRRIAERGSVMPFARTFDEEICLVVGDTLRMDRHGDARIRIFLPRHLGGMRIVKNTGMASEKGQLISRLALIEFLDRFYHHELTNL